MSGLGSKQIEVSSSQPQVELMEAGTYNAMLDSPNLDKSGISIGKRPMSQTESEQNNSDFMDIHTAISKANSLLSSVGLPQQLFNVKDVEFKVGERGGSSSRDHDSEFTGNFEDIRAHFNPAFEEMEGTLVPISEGMLDLAKHCSNFQRKFTPQQTR